MQKNRVRIRQCALSAGLSLAAFFYLASGVGSAMAQDGDLVARPLPPGWTDIEATRRIGDPGYRPPAQQQQQQPPAGAALQHLPEGAQTQAIPPNAFIDPVLQQQEVERAQRQSREEAFENALSTFLPLSPDQILQLRERLDEQQFAVSHEFIQRLPTTRSIDVSLAPGAQPPVINLQADTVTTLNFIDVTGAPWPVAATVVGNPGSFSVNAPIEGGNIVTISALGAYSRGNMAISLLDLATPIVVQFQAGNALADYRVDMRVGDRGPRADSPINFLSPPPVVGDELLSGFLDGVAPDGARSLQVAGGPARAWLFDGHLYLRTPMTLLSPAWESSATGAAGMRVYRLPETPVLLASDQGRLVNISLSE